MHDNGYCPNGRTTITNHKDSVAMASSAAAFCLGALRDHSFIVRLFRLRRTSVHLSRVPIDPLDGANMPNASTLTLIKKRLVRRKTLRFTVHCVGERLQT